MRCHRLWEQILKDAEFLYGAIYEDNVPLAISGAEELGKALDEYRKEGCVTE